MTDEIGLGKTFTSVAAAMFCNLVTENVVMVLPLSILCRNTFEEWVNLAENNFPGIIGDEREWYPLRRQNSVPRRLIEIQSTLLQGHPALTSTFESILVATMPGVAETFNSVIDEMTYECDFKLINLLHMENANLTHKDLNTSIEEAENRWNIQHVSYHTLTLRAKPSSNGQPSYCLWSFEIFDESHWYKTINSVSWRIAMNASIGFKLEVTTTLEFPSLYDWCFQMMRLFSVAPEDPENETLMEKHGAEALYSAVKSLILAIWTEDQNAQQDAAHQMIQIAKPWTKKRWSESKLPNGKPLVRISKENAHLVDLEWTEEEQAKLMTLVERYTSQGASGVWRVHRWRLASCSLVLGDTDDWNDI